MKFEELPKPLRDKRKINYVLVILAVIVLIMEFTKMDLKFHLLGILLLFMTAFFNTEGRVQMSFDEEDEELQKHKVTETKDTHSLICALAAAVINVITIVLYFV